MKSNLDTRMWGIYPLLKQYFGTVLKVCPREDFFSKTFPVAVPLSVTTAPLVSGQRVQKRGKSLKKISWCSWHFEKPFPVLNLSLSLFVNCSLFSRPGPCARFIYTLTLHLLAWHPDAAITSLFSLFSSLRIIFTTIMNSCNTEKSFRRARRCSQCFCGAISLWSEFLSPVQSLLLGAWWGAISSLSLPMLVYFWR